MKKALLLFMSLFTIFSAKSQSQDPPVKVAVIGLTHTHVHWILEREDRGDIQIVGIVEPNQDLAERYMEQHDLSMSLVYPTMEAMMEKVSPEAVTAFGTIYDHLEVVEFFAPKGIHVMVEKPLAVSLEHAQKMQRLAKENDIHLLTNYETTWYGSNLKVKEMVTEGTIGDIRKIVVHDGHPGPKEIGVNAEFLEWLIDPKWNGAGALTDFGCYGANLATWLMNGERPQSVFAMTATNKPNIYPLVDDEATIILQYPKTQVIIQASWNWPVSRKDMEVYGVKGQLIADNGSTLRYQLGDDHEKLTLRDLKKESPNDDPFTLLAATVRGQIDPQGADLSALENNMIVMEILQAAMESAKSGKVVRLK
jgi:predicted dehydrogenase